MRVVRDVLLRRHRVWATWRAKWRQDPDGSVPLMNAPLTRPSPSFQPIDDISLYAKDPFCMPLYKSGPSLLTSRAAPSAAIVPILARGCTERGAQLAVKLLVPAGL